MASKSLYETLGVKDDADAAEIKRAYLKLARETHPDKCGNDEAATARFQELGRAYSVLKDQAKRQLYDQAGIVDDGTSLNADGAPWEQVWRDFFSQVTTEKLDELAAEYRGSEDELADLHRAYTDAKGDLDGVMEAMMHCTAEDEPRYRQLLQAAIDAGKLRKYRAFTHEAKTKQQRRAGRAKQEAAEAEEHARELGLGEAAASGGADALRTAIVARQGGRQAGFDSLVDSLAARYSGGGKGGAKAKGGKAKAKGGGKSSAPPTDEEFERIQAELASRAAKKR